MQKKQHFRNIVAQNFQLTMLFPDNDVVTGAVMLSLKQISSPLSLKYINYG